MNPLLVIFNKTENNNKFLIKPTNHMTIAHCFNMNQKLV